MNIVHSLHNLLSTAGNNIEHNLSVIGGQRPFESKAAPAKHYQATPQQWNAQIAADGARMYQQAHPGKTYVLGQNGETYPGGVDKTLYKSLVNAAQPKITYDQPTPDYMMPGAALQRTLQGRQARPTYRGQSNLQQGNTQVPVISGYPMKDIQGNNTMTQAPNLQQGARFNPGYTPLQSRNFNPQNTFNIQ